MTTIKLDELEVELRPDKKIPITFDELILNREKMEFYLCYKGRTLIRIPIKDDGSGGPIVFTGFSATMWATLE